MLAVVLENEELPKPFLDFLNVRDLPSLPKADSCGPLDETEPEESRKLFHHMVSLPLIWVFQMWLLKVFSVGVSILIYSPVRNPTWPEEAEVHFKGVVKEISIFQNNLNSMT